MTRAELLELVIGQARSEGFNLRRWYVGRLGRPWVSTEGAVQDLSKERRYYALLFSHEFACSFWKPGGSLTLQIPEQSFPRSQPDGSIRMVVRKGYQRRTRPDAWQFHLREMAVQEEPLRYVRRFLRVVEELAEAEETAAPPIVVVDEEDLLPEDED